MRRSLVQLVSFIPLFLSSVLQLACAAGPGGAVPVAPRPRPASLRGPLLAPGPGHATASDPRSARATAAHDSEPSSDQVATEHEPLRAERDDATSATHHAFQRPMPAGETPASAPAMRYATLSPAACRTELARRKLAVTRVPGNVRGVATPVRLPQALGGVRLIVPPKSSKFGVLDCRLALALDDLSRVLAEHDVVAMRIDNFHRPWSRLSKRVKSQHHYGLAADIVSFTLRDGRTLSVERDWQAGIGAPVCGPEATLAVASDEAIRLRNIVCDVARRKLFHHMLTPSYDRAHREHFHWDIKRKGYAVIVR